MMLYFLLAYKNDMLFLTFFCLDAKEPKSQERNDDSAFLSFALIKLLHYYNFSNSFSFIILALVGQRPTTAELLHYCNFSNNFSFIIQALVGQATNNGTTNTFMNSIDLFQ
jgi:hypothetical protein